MRLEYGMTLFDKIHDEMLVVGRYWDTDTDPMGYKVKLFSMDGSPVRNFYSCDLVSLIKDGEYVVIKPKENSMSQKTVSHFLEGIEYKFLKLNAYEYIREGDLHSLDEGQTLNVILNEDTIGQRPIDFAKDRSFWREIKI